MGMNFTNLRILFLLVAVAFGLLFLFEQRLDEAASPEAFREWVDEWLFRLPSPKVLCIVLVTLLSAFVAGKMLHIGHIRRHMFRYAEFLRDSYADRPVDPLLYRKWSETVEAYNQSRSHWPFRLFWRAAEAGIFQQREGPPREAGLAVTGASGDMGKRKPYRKNKKR